MIELKDLSPEQREIAELIGLENYLKLSRQAGGTTLYIAKIEEAAARRRRDERICREFNGSNAAELAKKYGLTEVWVRSIVAEKLDELRRAPIPGQMSLENFLGRDQ